MTQVSAYEPGSFCWTDLGSMDWKAAKKFYTSLFGWTTKEIPMGENAPPYVMFQKNGQDICAVYQGDPGMPAFWLTYIAVKNADESAKKAKQLGATVHKDPFDVLDVGRMAVLGDPQGAGFAIWQEKRNPNAPLPEGTGTRGWSELHTTDTKSAQSFYTSLFGWKPKVSPEYTEFNVGSRAVGGMMNVHEGEPPNWLNYFMVDDVDATVKKAKSLGAGRCLDPMDIENVGRFSVISDPEGAFFAVIKLT